MFFFFWKIFRVCSLQILRALPLRIRSSKLLYLKGFSCVRFGVENPIVCFGTILAFRTRDCWGFSFVGFWCFKLIDLKGLFCKILGALRLYVDVFVSFVRRWGFNLQDFRAFVVAFFKNFSSHKDWGLLSWEDSEGFKLVELEGFSFVRSWGLNLKDFNCCFFRWQGLAAFKL